MNDYWHIQKLLRHEGLGFSQKSNGRDTKQPPYLAAFQATILEMFPSHIHALLDDKSVVLLLSNGCTLTITVKHDALPSACAEVLDVGHYCIWISSGLLRAIFECTADIWDNQLFAPWVEGLSFEKRITEQIALPRGVEYVMLQQQAEPKSTTEQIESPAWLRGALLHFDGARKIAFETSVREAFRSIVLHELEHVRLGHLGYLDANRISRNLSETALNLSEIGGIAPSITPQSRHAMEIEADRSASNILFEMARRREAREKLLQKGVQIQCSMVGGLMPMILFHASNVFRDVHEESRTHPPIWFRGLDIYAEASKRRSGVEASNRLLLVMMAVAEMHPIYADWIGPITEGALHSSSIGFLENVRSEYTKIQKSVSDFRINIIPRPTEAEVFKGH